MYDTDLAAIHHAGFSQFASDAAPGLLEELRKARISTGQIVDLGCGSGVWLRKLADAGYRGWGIDVSPAMIRIARTVAPEAQLHIGSLENTHLPRCDAITAIGEVLCYRPQRRIRRFTLGDCLRKMAGALRPGGLLLFDLLVTASGPPMQSRAWQAGDSWAVLVDAKENRERKILIREIHTFRREGSSYRRSHESHCLDVVPRREVEQRLRDLGFRVRVSRRYGLAELPPQRLAFVARKLET